MKNFKIGDKIKLDMLTISAFGLSVEGIAGWDKRFTGKRVYRIKNDILFVRDGHKTDMVNKEWVLPMSTNKMCK